MTGETLTYVVVTPAHDEAEHLPRLAASLEEQSALPIAWVVVDDGSRDATSEVAASLARSHSWIHLHKLARRETRRDARCARGARVPRGPAVGQSSAARRDRQLDAASRLPRLLGRTPRRVRCGAGTGDRERCLPRARCVGSWQRRYGTGTGVLGACRAYRTVCLDEIGPLEERQAGTHDALKAVVRGLADDRVRAASVLPPPSRGRTRRLPPSRVECPRRTAHFIGYRPTYVALRALFRARREPAAAAITAGYLRAALARAPS